MVEFRQYAKDYIERFGPRPNDFSELLERHQGKAERARPDDAEYVRTLYDAALAYVDSELNRFFRELKRGGLYDESFILLTGDHGEAFYDHATYGHAKNLYQELTHVPLIVKWPGNQPTGSVDALVTHVDIFPTFLAESGISPPPTEGLSLESFVEPVENQQPDRAVVSDSSWEDRFRRETMLSVRIDDMKYIAVFPFVPLGDLSFRALLREELYDLTRDPEEEHNLIGTSRVDPLPFRRIVEEHLDAAGTFRAHHRGDPVEVDEDTRRDLESLGYLVK